MAYYPPPPGGYPPPMAPRYPPGGYPPQQPYAYPPQQQPMYAPQPPMPMPMYGGGGYYPQQPMYGYPQQQQQVPPMMAPGRFPAGYPTYMGQVGSNMYFKPVWTPKREAKLQRLWYQVARDGIITWNEVIRILHAFHYKVTPHEAQWFFATMDKNRDGRIDYVELRQAMIEFIVAYPRHRNPYKQRHKAHYGMGYNWTMNPMFPGHFRHLWRF